MALRFLVIVISYRVEQKLIHDHQVTADEVQEAVGRRTTPRWALDKNGINRVLFYGVTDGDRRLRISLYPTGEDGVWRLGTAFPVQ